MSPDQILGHSVSYWMELEKHVQDLDVSHLIEELAEAHGKIGFYEQRVKEMDQLMRNRVSHDRP